MEGVILWQSVRMGFVKRGVSPGEGTSFLEGKVGVSAPPSPSHCCIGTEELSRGKKRL